jgi:Arm DNA-binding domain/Phage integrase, N-terminal SAM-like domain
MQLTDVTLRSLKPDLRQRTYFDDSLTGFGLRVNPGGTRTFILMHGPSRQLTKIGRVGVISLKDARQRAREILAEDTLGNHRAPTLSFQDAYERFKTMHCARKKPRTSQDYQRIINVHYLPKLRHVRLSDISPHALSKITDKLIHTPSEHGHAQAVGRTFFKWAVGKKYIKQSPLEGVKVSLGVPRDRVLDDAELVLVWRAAEKIGKPRRVATCRDRRPLYRTRRGRQRISPRPDRSEGYADCSIARARSRNQLTHQRPPAHACATARRARPERREGTASSTRSHRRTAIGLNDTHSSIECERHSRV